MAYLSLSYDDDPSKGIKLSPSGTSSKNVTLKLPLTDGLLLNDQSPSIAGHVHLTAFGKGNTDRILTIQSNNGELYLYPDGSSDMHFAGVGCYFDNTVYFGNGFAFPTYASSLQGNGTNLTGFAQGWFNAAAVGTVQTGTDWNAGQARDNCNFVVKNRRQDVGNPASVRGTRFQTHYQLNTN